MSKTLSQIAKENGFTKKGSCFYRIQGDQILQLLKFERGRYLSHKKLGFGIYSLYSKFHSDFQLHPMGVVLQYPVMCCVKEGRYVDTPEEEALAVLENDCMLMLNQLLTQRELLDAMCKYDIRSWVNVQSVDSLYGLPYPPVSPGVKVKGSIFLQDTMKIAPALKIKHYALIEEIISRMLFQHNLAGISNSIGRKYTPEERNAYRLELLYKLDPLMDIYRLYHNLKDDEVNQMLEDNLKTNLKLLEFVKR